MKEKEEGGGRRERERDRGEKKESEIATAMKGARERGRGRGRDPQEGRSQLLPEAITGAGETCGIKEREGEERRGVESRKGGRSLGRMR